MVVKRLSTIVIEHFFYTRKRFLSYHPTILHQEGWL